MRSKSPHARVTYHSAAASSPTRASTAWLAMSVGHASMTTIRVEADGTMRVIAVGDVGHVPPTMRTGALGDPERTLALPGR